LRIELWQFIPAAFSAISPDGTHHRISELLFLFLSGNKFFNSALKDTSFKEDTVMALKAFYAYISPQPHHLPLIATTGMFLLEPNNIT